MWFFYAIATILLWGFADLFYKKGASVEDKYSHLKTVFMVGLVLGFQAFIVLFRGYEFDFYKIIQYLPVTSMYILSMAIGYYGLKYIEMSISSPVSNSSGAIAALLTFIFMGQTMEPLQLFAVALISIGIVLLAKLESNDGPKNIIAEDKKYYSSLKAFMFPIMYMVIDGIGTFLDGFYLDSEIPLFSEEDSIIAYGITFLIVGIVSIIYVVFVKKEKFKLIEEKDRGIAAVFEGIGQLFYVYAMADNAILSQPTISAYCMVSVILGRIILKEKLNKLQYLVIAVVMVGIIILGLA